MTSFGERLKELRKAKNLSQRDLARDLHLGVSTVAMYETGSREPDFEMISRIADYFGVTTDYLLGRTDDPHDLPSSDLTVFAHRLRTALASAEKTQRDLARSLNVAESTVSQWASGKRLPDLPTAARLASLLNVSVDYLMGRTDDPHSVAQTVPNEAPDDELYVVFRGKRQELSPEYKRLLILMMEDANRKLREEQEKKK